jgi:tRNA(fMet)-specific endonuclease VapC
MKYIKKSTHASHHGLHSHLAILSAIEVLPFEEPADQRYGELRADLERRGASIGPNDMLIAAHALMLDCIVVTANVREFSRVRGLRVENWLQD